ncbi:MAG TPA: hypothetical protein PLG90_04820 [Ignavibacteria bacterium]|nr:hypothetical protein [Ignavibacteria bacterium]
MSKIYSIITLILFFCNACLIPGESNTVLKNTLPDDLKIQYTRHTGMLPEYENLLITKDSCVLIEVTDKTVDTTKFKLSEQELKKLYNIFLENNFSGIETTIEEVYDRGGATITLSWKNGVRKSVEKSNAGRSFVKEEWLIKWNNIVNTILNTIETAKKSEQ